MMPRLILLLIALVWSTPTFAQEYVLSETPLIYHLVLVLGLYRLAQERIPIGVKTVKWNCLQMIQFVLMLMKYCLLTMDGEFSGRNTVGSATYTIDLVVFRTFDWSESNNLLYGSIDSRDGDVKLKDVEMTKGIIC